MGARFGRRDIATAKSERAGRAQGASHFGDRNRWTFSLGSAETSSRSSAIYAALKMETVRTRLIPR
jgi:hypothetical protein